MHPELSQPGKLVQTAYLNVPVETAWQLLTDPQELPRWMGEGLRRAEVGQSKGEDISFYLGPKDSKYIQPARILLWEPPYKLSYGYWHVLSSLPKLPEHMVTVIFHLTALPGDKTMVYLAQTGFPDPFTFDQAEWYWRTALTRLQQLYFFHESKAPELIEKPID